MLDDGESEAGAADLARASAVSSVETFEDTLQMFRRDPLAGIGDADNIVQGAAMQFNGDLAIFNVELDRVIDEIGQHLFEPGRVGPNNGFFGHFVDQRDAKRGGLVREIEECLIDRPREIDIARLDRCAARFDR